MTGRAVGGARRRLALVVVFAALALSLSVPIVGLTTAHVQTIEAGALTTDHEVRGLRYVQRTLDALGALQEFRRTLSSPAWKRRERPRGELAARRAAASAAFARIEEPAAANDWLNGAIADKYLALRDAWGAFAAKPRGKRASDVADAALALLTAISDASRITYDPAIEGLNLGDGLTARFPAAGEYAMRAVLLACPDTAGGKTLHERFRAARLLAQAQALIDMGSGDIEDAAAANARIAASLRERFSGDQAAFARLDRLITTEIESTTPPTARERPKFDQVAAAIAATTTAIDQTLGADLERALRLRLAQASRSRWLTLLAGAAALLLDGLAMFVLAHITLRRNAQALERARAAEAALQTQLAHARSEQALLLAKAQFRAVFDRAPQGMILIDRTGRALDANDAAHALFPGGSDQTAAEALIDGHREILAEIFAGDRDAYHAELQLAGGDGRTRWITLAISLVDDGGTPLFALAIMHDTSERKALEHRLIFEATHDPLTGLPNRRLFIELLQASIDRRDVDRRSFCVLFVDFNDFKTINDSLGHGAGDQFLIEAAKRLRAAVRAHEVVARLGGDEFAILLRADDREFADGAIERAVARLQLAASTGIEIDGLPVATSASFGVAPDCAHYRRADEMLRDADTAMYQAKAQAQRAHVIFDNVMRERVVRRMQLASDLSLAVSRNEFELLYQPIVALEDGRVVGGEALIRWRRGTDGLLISPNDFIPLAEETGSIIEIGRWVMATVCAQLRAWEDDGTLPTQRGLRIHVNLAVPEVDHRDVVAELRRTLAASGVRPDQIVLEITESIVLDDAPRTREALRELRASGLALCIDDFGTGYSSLRYLHELPLRSFKIDRAFVAGTTDLANAPIVEMMLILGRSLGLDVIAEGIETDQQWAALRDLGCRFGQGYRFSPPLDADAFRAAASRRLGRRAAVSAAAQVPSGPGPRPMPA